MSDPPICPTRVMPAAVFMGARVAVEDRPTPAPGPRRAAARGQPLRDLRSDLHFLLEWGGRAGVIEGHEFSGTVAAVGDGVTVEVGDRVVGGPSPQCGKCEYCLPDRLSLCVERGRVAATTATGRAPSRATSPSRAADALRVPDGLSLKHAALTEPLAVALHGITQGGGARPGTRWLVTGGGHRLPVGRGLKALGVDDIVVSEPKARAAGCARSSARGLEPEELVTPRWPHDLVDEPFDVALECSGNGRAQESAPRSSSARARSCSSARAWPAQVRPEPHSAERARDHRRGRVRLDGFSSARSTICTASGELQTDLLVEPEDYPLNKLLDTALGLHEGAVRGQGHDRSPHNSKDRHDLHRPDLRRKSHRPGPAFSSRKPRMNHVAMSLAPGEARRGAPQACAPTSLPKRRLLRPADADAGIDTARCSRCTTSSSSCSSSPTIPPMTARGSTISGCRSARSPSSTTSWLTPRRTKRTTTPSTSSTSRSTTMACSRSRPSTSATC